MGFKPCTERLQSQGLATELQLIPNIFTDFLDTNLIKMQQKFEKPEEKSLTQLSI